MENEKLATQWDDMDHLVASKSVMRVVEKSLVYSGVHGLFFVTHLVGRLFVTVTEQETARHLH
jgi:hypothetical protein